MRRALAALVSALGRRHARARLRRELDGVWARGLPEARAALAGGPAVLAANHVAWWDSLLVAASPDWLGRPVSVLMDERRLAEFPFFAAFGAFGVDRHDPRRALAGLRAAVARAATRPVWVFPQGRQRPAHLRPLELQPGVLAIARRAGAQIVPVAIAYVFREAPVPAVYLDFGPPLPPDASLEALDAALRAGLDRIDATESDPASFVALIPPPRPATAAATALRWLWNATPGALDG